MKGRAPRRRPQSTLSTRNIMHNQITVFMKECNVKSQTSCPERVNPPTGRPELTKLPINHTERARQPTGRPPDLLRQGTRVICSPGARSSFDTKAISCSFSFVHVTTGLSSWTSGNGRCAIEA